MTKVTWKDHLILIFVGAVAMATMLLFWMGIDWLYVNHLAWIVMAPLTAALFLGVAWFIGLMVMSFIKEGKGW